MSPEANAVLRGSGEISSDRVPSAIASSVLRRVASASAMFQAE